MCPEQDGDRDLVKIHKKRALATLGNLPTGLVVCGCFVFNQDIPWGSPIDRV